MSKIPGPQCCMFCARSYEDAGGRMRCGLDTHIIERRQELSEPLRCKQFLSGADKAKEDDDEMA